MVPALDMVNHSATATAYYEEEASGDVSLRIRPGLQVAAGQEISISYGDSKSAAEMLFSYGFIDPDSKTRELTLHLDGFPDDPLAMAKLRVFGGAPTVTFRQAEPDRSGSSCMLWESGFVHLMCLNEEDGLEFCILQDDAGDRQLRVLWQDEDVTDRADRFEKLLDGHPLQALFQLRSVSVVQQQAATQLDKLNVAPDAELLEPLISAGLVDQNYVNLVAELRDSERLMLETAVAELEREVRVPIPSSAMHSSFHCQVPQRPRRSSGFPPRLRISSPLRSPFCPFSGVSETNAIFFFRSYGLSRTRALWLISGRRKMAKTS